MTDAILCTDPYQFIMTVSMPGGCNCLALAAWVEQWAKCVSYIYHSHSGHCSHLHKSKGMASEGEWWALSPTVSGRVQTERQAFRILIQYFLEKLTWGRRVQLGANASFPCIFNAILIVLWVESVSLKQSEWAWMAATLRRSSSCTPLLRQPGPPGNARKHLPKPWGWEGWALGCFRRGDIPNWPRILDFYKIRFSA